MPKTTKPRPVDPRKMVRPGRILFVVPESPFSQKSTGWFIATMLLFTLVVAGLVWYHYYLQAIALALGVALFYYFGIREPEKQLCTMTERGITFRGLRYPFEYFKHFSIWLDRFGEGGVIILNSRDKLRITLHLRFEGVDYTPIRLFLRQYLAEQLHAPTVLDDFVARLLRI